MSRRWFAAIGALGLLLTGCDNSTPTQTPAKRPSGEPCNVILVSVDTTRADHIGCYGHPRSRTPNIDRLAAEGVRFDACIASGPVTLPSHATMMTGAYPFVHGARANGTFRVSPSNVTLAELFQQNGYATHAEVSAGVLNRSYGLDQGFGSYHDMLSVGTDERLERDSITERAAPGVTDGGIAFMQGVGDQPFFLFLHYYEPHLPYTPPAGYEDLHPYLGEIAYFDSEFGRLMAAVEELPTADRTLVILTSDHGEGLGEHGENGHAFFLYDTNLHVPLIFWHPGGLPQGQVVSHQVRHIDLAPTILELLGWETPPAVQGQSLQALWTNPDTPWDQTVYAETFYPKVTFGYSPLRTLRTRQWKYIHAPKPELYDLKQDRGEQSNLAAAQPQRVAEMRTRMRNLIADAPAVAADESRMEMSVEERRRLESLGYVGGSGADDVIAEGDELDRFEPEGRNPSDYVEVFTLLERGRTELLQRNWSAAKATYEEMLRMAPDSPFAYVNLARALTELGELDAAVEHYRQAQALKPSDVIPALGIGKIQLFQRKFDEADKSFEQAIRLDPRWHTPYFELGHLRMQQKRFAEAVAAFATAVELSQGEPQVHLQHGRALQANGQTKEAEAAYRAAMAADPKLPTPRLRLGLLLLSTGQREAGRTELSALHQEVPEDIRVIRALATHYTQSGDHAAALPYYRLAAQLRPDEPGAQHNLALNLHQQSQLTEALPYYQRATDLAPEQTLFFDGLLRALRELNRSDDAIAAGRARIAARPNDPYAYRITAGLLSQADRAHEGTELLRAGRAACPDAVALDLALAWHLLAVAAPTADGDAEALTLAKALLDKAPDNTQLLDLLGAAHAAVGNWDEAVQTVEQAIRQARDVGDEGLVKQLESRRDGYRAQRAYRGD